MKLLGNLEKGLGIQIKRNSEKELIIHHSGYIRKKLDQYNVNPTSKRSTPITTEPKVFLETANTEKEIIDEYSSLVGSLNYTSVALRFDISFAVHYLSRSLKEPNTILLQKAKSVYSYLNNFPNLGIKYSGSDCSGSVSLTAYVDSDFGNTNDRKNVSGFVVLLAGGAISWSSRKQKLVTLSSAESEYVALSECVQEILHLKRILEEIGFTQNGIKIFTDNKSSIDMASSDRLTQRTKHLDCKYRFVNQFIGKEIVLEYVKSSDNCADMFTKALSGSVFSQHCQRLGLVEVSQCGGALEY